MLLTPDPEVAARVRGFLQEAGYTEAALCERPGGAASPRPRQADVALFLHGSARPSARRTLLTWFLAGRPVVRAEAEATVPGWLREFCLGHGLLACEGEAWIPRVLLLPCGPFWVAADHYRPVEKATLADHVLAPGPSAQVLISGTLPVAARRTLDLGTGGGILAFHAARRSDSVVATDLNSRAVAFARFGARLNGLENIDIRVGDAYSPVTGERFDHIVCNPPFVLSPGSGCVYRDNPMLLDAFVRDLARASVEHLDEHGCYQMVCEWAEVEGEPWPERLAGWFADSGCDAWILHGNTRPVAQYAHARIRELALADADAEADLLDDWMAYYRDHRLRAVHGGLVTLRRRNGSNWLRIDAIADDDAEDLGAVLVAGFAARDFLDRASEEGSLPGARLQLSPTLRMQVGHRAGADGWQVETIEAHVTNGLNSRTTLDATAAEFLRLFDGRRTVEEVIAALAGRLGLDADAVRAGCLQNIGALLEQGFLVTGRDPRHERAVTGSRGNQPREPDGCAGA